MTSKGTVLTLLELAEQHVDQDTVCVDRCLRHAAQLFVCPMHWVAGLEGDNGVPTAVGDVGAQFDSSAEALGKITGEVGEVENLYWAGDQRVASGFESGDTGVALVVGAENLADDGVAIGAGKRFDRGDFLHRDNGIAIDIGILERDAAACGDAIGNPVGANDVYDGRGPE